MKKFIMLCVAVICSLSMYAQIVDNSKPDKRFTFGIRMGANISNMSKSSTSYFYFGDSKSKWGFHGGMIADYNFTKSWAVETGLYFTQKGAKFDNHVNHYSQTDNFNRNYLQLPIMALLRLYVANNMHVQLKTGGFAGIMVDGLDHQERKVDAGIVWGAGISYRKVYLGIQYELGLVADGRSYGMKDRNLAISVGYDF